MRTPRTNLHRYVPDLTCFSSLAQRRESKCFPCGCSEPARHPRELFMTRDVRITATDSLGFVGANRTFCASGGSGMHLLSTDHPQDMLPSGGSTRPIAY